MINENKGLLIIINTCTNLRRGSQRSFTYILSYIMYVFAKYT